MQCCKFQDSPVIMDQYIGIDIFFFFLSFSEREEDVCGIVELRVVGVYPGRTCCKQELYMQSGSSKPRLA